MEDQQEKVSENVPEKVPEKVEDTSLEERVVEALKTCYDPEIPVDIHTLGLIYKVEVKVGGEVEIDMTLTSPACPVAGTLPPEVENKVAALEGVSSAKVTVVWEPVWTPEKMTEAARLQLGML
jgi:FeS assembly SUF system protein